MIHQHLRNKESGGLVLRLCMALAHQVFDASVLHLTLVGKDTKHRDDTFLSDQGQMFFSLADSRSEVQFYRNPNSADWDTYREVMSSLLAAIQEIIKSIIKIQFVVDIL